MSYGTLRKHTGNKGYLKMRDILRDKELSDFQIKNKLTQKFVSKYEEESDDYHGDKSWKSQSKTRHQYK